MRRSTLLPSLGSVLLTPAVLAVAPHLALAQGVYDLQTCTARAEVTSIPDDDWLAVRTGPGAGNAELGRIHLGDVVAVCGGEGNWARVRTGGGLQGWSYAGYLTRGPDAAPGTPLPPPVGAAAGTASTRAENDLWTCTARARVDGIADNDFLAVRSGPGTGYGQLGEMHRGDVVAVCGGQGDWARVITPAGQRGWSYATGNLTRIADAAPGAALPLGSASQQAGPQDGSTALSDGSQGPSGANRPLSQDEMIALFQGNTVTVQRLQGSGRTIRNYFAADGESVFNDTDGSVAPSTYAIQGGQLCFTPNGGCTSIRETATGDLIGSDRTGDQYVVLSVQAGDVDQLVARAGSDGSGIYRGPRMVVTGLDGRPLPGQDLSPITNDEAQRRIDEGLAAGADMVGDMMRDQWEFSAACSQAGGYVMAGQCYRNRY